MDPIQALMMPVSDEDQMQALARSLRGRQTAADFFSASSIPNLQKMAQSEQEYIKDVGARQGVLREALERRKQDQKQHEDAMAYRNESLAQSAADRQEAMALRLAIAQMRGGGSGAGFDQPRTQKERAAFEAGGSELEKFNSLADTYQDSYSATVPLMGGVENFVNRNVTRFIPGVPDEIKSEGLDQAEWWSDYKEYAELVRRHGLFGSALTKNESEEWKKATISPNDDPKIIQRKLASQRDFMRRKTEKAAANAMLKGYDPDQIRVNFGGALDLDALAERLASGDYSFDGSSVESEPEPEPESVAPEMDLSGLSDDELRAIINGN